MKKVLDDIQEYLINQTDGYDFNIYTNKIQSSETKSMVSVIFFENNLNNEIVELCGNSLQSKVLIFRLFNSVEDDEDKAYEIYELIKDKMYNYINNNEYYYIIDSRINQDNGHVGMDASTSASVYECKFEIRYGVL